MVKQEPAIAIVVLAAGSSERMGREKPKQLLPWGGTTLLGHAITQCISVEASEVFVVLGAYYEQVRKEAGRFPVTVVRNEEWGEGLGTSVAAAAAHLFDTATEFRGVLFTLADQPLFDRDYLDEMIGRFETGSEAIVATSYNGNPGVPALFDACYLSALARVTGDAGAKPLMARHRDQVTTVDAGERTADIDTPEAYRELYQKYVAG